jgi:hypothetical protein
MDPVEKTRIKIIMFKTKIPKGFSPPKFKKLLPFFLRDNIK